MAGASLNSNSRPMASVLRGSKVHADATDSAFHSDCCSWDRASRGCKGEDGALAIFREGECGWRRAVRGLHQAKRGSRCSQRMASYGITSSTYPMPLPSLCLAPNNTTRSVGLAARSEDR